MVILKWYLFWKFMYVDFLKFVVYDEVLIKYDKILGFRNKGKLIKREFKFN